MGLFEERTCSTPISTRRVPGAAGISERIDAMHATLAEADGSAPEITVSRTSAECPHRVCGLHPALSTERPLSTEAQLGIPRRH